MKSLITLALLGVASASFAGTFYYDNSLTTSSPTFAFSGASSAGTGVHYYNVFAFSVDVTGAYNIETASPNTSTTGISNALDTFLVIYANSFNPASSGGELSSNDDFTGSLTVLPGPYAGTVGTTGTGFTGAQPASQFSGINLTAGTAYYLVNTSYRSTDYVQSASGGEGAPVGHFYTGISGPGNINAVPEPASMAVLGLGAMSLLRRRKKTS